MPTERGRATVAVVLAGGEPAGPEVRPWLPPGALVVAADSGLHLAEALGLAVDVLVGDLDSADAAAVERASAAGARVEAHPAAKDHTDLELALRAAREAGARDVLVLGAGGGRLDHFLAAMLLLASPELADVRIEALVGSARVAAVHDRIELHGEPGDLLTLLAAGGPARGVRTEGLRYPLHGEDLLPGSTRGVSNELVDRRAEVTLAGGALLAVQPDALARGVPSRTEEST